MVSFVWNCIFYKKKLTVEILHNKKLEFENDYSVILLNVSKIHGKTTQWSINFIKTIVSC